MAADQAQSRRAVGRLCLGLWMAAPAWMTVLTREY